MQTDASDPAACPRCRWLAFLVEAITEGVADAERRQERPAQVPPDVFVAQAVAEWEERRALRPTPPSWSWAGDRGRS